MGTLLGRFKRKKDTKEILESLEDKIIYIENMTSNTSPINYYKIIFHSALLYGLISILYYFGILTYKIVENRYLMAILAAYPIIALYYYKFDVWYYNRKIVAYKKKLVELRSEKKKILDEVMENETFKVAKEILEKYDPRQLQSMTSQNFSNQRMMQSPNNKPQYASSGKPMNQRMPNMGRPPAIMSSSVSPRLNLPRPIISNNRTIFDRLADIVLGDGPQNRYALICRTCGSHNGMARKEEFDFLAYRCAYCSQWNPSLKPRPQLAIGYANNAVLEPQSHITSTETIEEITDDVSLKSGSDTNESDKSEQKDELLTNGKNSDSSSPIIEEIEDAHQSDNADSENENTEEKSSDKSKVKPLPEVEDSS